MNDSRQEGPRGGRAPRATKSQERRGGVEGAREVQAEVHEQLDAAGEEPARSICEAVQRLVAATVGDGRDEHA